MGPLHIHPRAQHVEEAIEASLGAGMAAVLGADRTHRRDLVERAWLARPRPPRVGSLGERLLVDAVAEEATGPLGPLRRARGFAEALRGIFAAWKQAGLGPRRVSAIAARAGGELSGPGRARLAELARLFARYDRLLGARSDEADVLRGAIESIRAGDPIPLLDGAERVIVHEAADLPPPWIELVEALGARGLAVEVRLPLVASPSAPRPQLERAVEPVLRALEGSRVESIEPVSLPVRGPDWLELPEDGPREWLLDALFRRRGEAAEAVAGAPVDLCVAPAPEVEARAVARAVRDLVGEGVAPEAIAVAVRDEGQRDRIAAWLARYGVPIVVRGGRSAAAATPVRIALRLYDLVDDGVPREGLIALVSSRYVPARGDAEWVPPHRVARALREAGVRDAGEEEGVPGYRRRLAELARAQPKRAAEIARVAARVEELLGLVLSLPAEASLAGHAASLERVIDGLGLELGARGYSLTAEAGLDDAERIARDQASIAALRRVLAELGRAAARAGLSALRFDRRRFARLLQSVLAGEAVRPGGARGGAVELGAPEDACGRRFEHLFLAGLEDGQLPARAQEDPLLADDERRAFNRAAGREVLPLASRREAAEPLTFLRALAAGGRIHLSHAAFDRDGRPRLRSPFLDEIERVAADLRVARPGYDPIPLAADARRPEELLARLALESEAPPEGRLAPPDPGLTAPLAKAARGRFAATAAAAAAVSAVERARLDFFDGKDDGAGPLGRFVGHIGDAALRARLVEVLPGSAERPLSPTAVEDYGRCPFRFFATRLLAAAAPEEKGDELDPTDGGRLYHRVLERLFRRAGGPLHRKGAAGALALLDETLGEVQVEWTERERRGHPALFAARVLRTRRELGALVAAEATTQPFGPHVPTHFEREFRLEVPPPRGAHEDEPPLVVRGKIDRIDVDVGAGSAVVIDYKAGGRTGLAAQLRDEALLVTSFQLPIYGAAARAELGLGAVSAAFYSIRDAQATKRLDDPALFALGPAERDGASPNVADELWRVHRAMRAGDFRVRPTTCERCDLAASCRVMIRRGGGEGGDAGAGERPAG